MLDCGVGGNTNLESDIKVPPLEDAGGLVGITREGFRDSVDFFCGGKGQAGGEDLSFGISVSERENRLG
jgi:hypothetical protein